jgi:hypothetical protein
MKFYTDPEFFFNIWCNELIKDNETRKIEKKQRKKVMKYLLSWLIKININKIFLYFRLKMTNNQ